jgi:transcriptional regulator with XRE-family HTH domain
MIDFNIIAQFGKNLSRARKDAGLNQQALAMRIGVSRDLIVRMEKGDNVGIHHILAAMQAVGRKLSLIEDGDVVAGSFDAFYQEHFRNSLEVELQANRNEVFSAGLVKPADASRIRIVNWKQAAQL